MLCDFLRHKTLNFNNMCHIPLLCVWQCHVLSDTFLTLSPCCLLGQSSAAFRRALQLRRVAVTRTASLAYDALWSVALALRATQREWRRRGERRALHMFDYSHADTAGDLFRATQQLNFTGVSVSAHTAGAQQTPGTDQRAANRPAVVVLHYRTFLASSRALHHCTV